jgi:3-oxoadipate enol-lactonase
MLMIGTLGRTTGTTHVEGADLYFEIAGEGPPLVLAHAGFVDCRMWDEQFPVFAEHHRVVRYDRRGFGQSAMAPGPFSHRHDLHGLLDVLGIERAHLIGCSAGGQVVTEFTLEHPERTASLVLISSALGGSPFQGEIPKPMQDLTVALQAEDVERAADLAVQIWIDGPHRTPDQVSTTIREQAREMARTALPNAFAQEQPLEPSARGRLNEIAAPTLVMVGELDDDSIKAIAEVLASGIRGAQKEVMSGVAHLPNMEKPEKFNQRVLKFLRQPSP